MKRFLSILVLSLACVLHAASAAAQQGATLQQVKQRGALNCGVNNGLPGFGVADAQGNWSGLDVDFCRAIAAAIFDDPTKVRFMPLNAAERFTALQEGRVDLLSRNSTWTLAWDVSLAINFGPPNFYDGQAFMVRRRLNVSSAYRLDNVSVCVQRGTTSELNLADFFRRTKRRHRPVMLATGDEAVAAYNAGRCDALTMDATALYAERLKLSNVDEHIILPEIVSKEPLAPVVRHGDDRWYDLVKWTHYAMVNAEELGVTKANAAEMATSDIPEVRRLLGAEGRFGEMFGLSNDWALRIIRHVGNYGERFDANLGENSRFRFDRGLNKLWSDGGLQFAPPIR